MPQYMSQKSPPVGKRKEPEEEKLIHIGNDFEWAFVLNCWQVYGKYIDQQLTFVKTTDVADNKCDINFKNLSFHLN